MVAENTFHFPKPGQRIVRSVIAVASASVCFIFETEKESRFIPHWQFFSVSSPIRTVWLRWQKKVTGTFVGAFWGLGDHSDPDDLCFHGSLMDTFPGYMLISPLHQEVYERRHRSPHRNYVQKTQSVYENVVYLYLLDKKKLWKNFTGN